MCWSYNWSRSSPKQKELSQWLSEGTFHLQRGMRFLQHKLQSRARCSTRYRWAACASMSLYVTYAPRLSTTKCFGAVMLAEPQCRATGSTLPNHCCPHPNIPQSRRWPPLPEWSDGLSRSSPPRRCRLKQFWRGNHNLPYSFRQLQERQRAQHCVNQVSGDMPFYPCWTLLLQIFRTKVSWHTHGCSDKGEEHFSLWSGAST